MVYFVLYHFCFQREEGRHPLPSPPIELEYFNFIISLCFSFTFQRETAFLCFVFARNRNKQRIEHHFYVFSVKKGQSSFLDAYHIGGYTQRAVFMKKQSILQIIVQLSTRESTIYRRLGKKYFILDNISDHITSSLLFYRLQERLSSPLGSLLEDLAWS